MLDDELAGGYSTAAEVMADPARRMKIQQSPLARELIAAYQGDAEGFSQAEAVEPPQEYKPVSQTVLDHIRQEVENGAKASEIASDPYTRQAAKNDPALKALIDEAARRNGD